MPSSLSIRGEKIPSEMVLTSVFPLLPISLISPTLIASFSQISFFPSTLDSFMHNPVQVVLPLEPVPTIGTFKMFIYPFLFSKWLFGDVFNYFESNDLQERTCTYQVIS